MKFNIKKNIIIHTLNDTYIAYIHSRPSKVIKTPYLGDCDVYTHEDDKKNNNFNKLSKLKKCEKLNVINNDVLVHLPSLGTCGLTESGKFIIVTPKNTKAKSKYLTQLTYITKPNTIIGINPMLANEIVHNMLKNNILKFIGTTDLIKPESTFGNSRIDFMVKKGKKTIYIEVKNVPLADHYDLSKVELKKLLKNDDFSKEYEKNTKKYNQKTAIFPDGYRKDKNAPVSERAVKHFDELIKIAALENHEAYLFYIIQRKDINSFSPSRLDKIYRDKFMEAVEKGVKIVPISVYWERDENCINKYNCIINKIIKIKYTNHPEIQ